MFYLSVLRAEHIIQSIARSTVREVRHAMHALKLHLTHLSILHQHHLPAHQDRY